MTDLLVRPSRRASRPPGSTAVSPRVSRPLTVSAVVAGLGSSVTTLVTCMGVALTGWFLADAGAHGSTNGALRVGSYLWLLGHGARLGLNGTPVGVIPLGLTLIFAAVAFRSGRWAGQTSQPVTDDRSFAIGAAIQGGLYVIVGMVTAVLAGQGPASVDLPRAFAGSLVIGGVVGGAGLAVGTGRFAAWCDRLPGWFRTVVGGATATVLMVMAASCVLVAGSLLWSWKDAASVMSGLHLQTGDAIMYTLACLVLLPNAALFGTSYLLGPGFFLGTGTVVSPSTVVLGPLPAVAPLAALPTGGVQPWWLAGLLGVPVILAAVGAGLAQRHYRVPAWDSAALRGFGVGLLAALVTTGLVALAGGPVGTGALASIGVPLGQVLAVAVAAMSLGGLVGGLFVTALQRRAAR